MKNLFIKRALTKEITRLHTHFPIITLTGPRQSGKTSLCKKMFPKFRYVNLEHPSTRAVAENAPSEFLEAFGSSGTVIDEAQRVPELFSAAQVLVDEDRSRKFIFTGSSNFLLMKNIAQSLAGRTAVLKLLPLSLEELGANRVGKVSAETLIFRGGYPAAWHSGSVPADVFANYYETYVERDVRQIEEIRNIRAFRNFIRLCAGSVGREFNAAAFANALGVTLPTVQSWFSVLEASYVVFALPPFFRNIGKRIVKRNKLYFYDTGLACWLLGIENAEQLRTHPLRGNLFENLVVLEAFKRRCSAGKNAANFFFYRDNTQNEVDLISANGEKLSAFEIKSAMEIHPELFKGLNYFRELFGKDVVSTQIICNSKIELPTAKNGIVNFRNFAV